MDVSQYLEIFLDETKEHLQSLNTQILELEQDSENMDTINEIFRAAHSLKGMAGTMGFKRMQNLTHDMENVFSEVRNGNIKVQPNMIDILFQCLDALEEYTASIQESADEGTNDNEPLIKRVIAVEGQTISVDAETDTVTVDGVKLHEPYILDQDIQRSGESYEYPLTIPKGKVFVMGDNRNDSFDSRDPGLGMVEEKYIMGKAIFRIYPFERVGGLD